MLFTNEQIQELLSIIDRFHIVFIGNQLGKGSLTKQDKSILKGVGIDINKFPNVGKLDNAFKFGVLASSIGNKAAKGLDFAKFKGFLSSGKFLSLSPLEQMSLESLKTFSYGEIKGLGNRISSDFRRITVEGDQKKRLRYQKVIKDEAEKAILDRKSVGQLASELGHQTKDWARDFDRMADYIMHSAFNHGRSALILTQEGDNAEIYFDVYEGACENCIRIYLTGKIGSEPRIFKLKDVIANGNNIGRKAKDWKATIDPTHPWCRCTINHKKENTKWDKKKRAFILVRNTYGVKRKSKVKIWVDGKEI